MATVMTKFDQLVENRQGNALSVRFRKGNGQVMERGVFSVAENGAKEGECK